MSFSLDILQAGAAELSSSAYARIPFGSVDTAHITILTVVSSVSGCGCKDLWEHIVNNVLSILCLIVPVIPLLFCRLTIALILIRQSTISVMDEHNPDLLTTIFPICF